MLQKRTRNKSRNQRLVLSQLSWLLTNKKDDVVKAFQEAGFSVDENASAEKLKGILRRAVVVYKDKKHPKAKKLIRNISALILLNEQEKSSFSNFFNIVSEGDKPAEKEKSTKGKWLKDNADTIGSIGGSLLAGLFSKGGNAQVDSQIGAGAGAGVGADVPKKKSRTGLIIGIGVGALAILGLTIYLVRKK